MAPGRADGGPEPEALAREPEDEAPEPEAVPADVEREAGAAEGAAWGPEGARAADRSGRKPRLWWNRRNRWS